MLVTTLGHWADLLLDAFLGAAPADASLVRLARPDDGRHDVELGLLPLAGRHPVDLLDGFVAPPSWLALGVATGGWAGPADGGPPSAHPDGVRVVQVVLVDRDGGVAGRVRFPDGTVLREPPAMGAVLAALRAARPRIPEETG